MMLQAGSWWLSRIGAVSARTNGSRLAALRESFGPIGTVCGAATRHGSGFTGGAAGSPFSDRVRLQATGGRGGLGVVAFETVDVGKKRPSGGMGGPGGDVVVRASESMDEIRLTTFAINGGQGTDASGRGKNGRRGRDTIIHVPCGTVVKEVDRTYMFEGDEAELASVLTEEERLELGMGPVHDTSTRGTGVEGEWEESTPSRLHGRSGDRYRERTLVMADLTVEGAQVVVATGGSPGIGNRHMPREQASSDETRMLSHIAGSPGESRFLELELRSLADVGLVGFPNAGKSSLLRELCKAKPKVAPYAFTTLRPVVGVARFDDGHAVRVADIPGLIAGAHLNKGLGHEFLRHVQRTRVLVYVVDAAGAMVSATRDLLAPEMARRIAERRAQAAGLSAELTKMLVDGAVTVAEQTATAREAGTSMGSAQSGSNHTQDTALDAVAMLVDAEMRAEGLLPSGDPSSAGQDDMRVETGARDPVSDLRALQAEVQAYNPAMAARPALVVASKCDVPGAAEGVKALREATTLPVIETSSTNHVGAGLLAQSLRFLCNKAPV